MTEDNKITKGSGNVFTDLGFANPQEHQMKADLVLRLSVIMKERGHTQLKTAKIIGLGQADLSKLLRGQFRGYSLNRLLGFIMALDNDIEIIIKKRPTNRKTSRMTIVAA
jgi:predicted XRE-type DNA-binding protein